jgi:hypothetical protein
LPTYSKSVCTSNILASPAPSTESTKTLENKNPEDGEPADKRDIQIEYSYD